MIFFDVGAHDGQTLEEVTKAKYGFRIFAFEPMPKQYAQLANRFGQLKNVTLLNYGLSDRTGRQVLYGNNNGMEASLYPSKRDVDATHQTSCEFVAASEFFKAFSADEPLIVKLNCEGAEVPILNSLIDSGEIWKIGNLMIDFDIRKVPGYEAQEDRILNRLSAIGFTAYHLCEDVMLDGETHQDRIASWLAATL